MRSGVLTLVVAASLLVSACAAERTDATSNDLSGDGVLDCSDGQVVRSAGVLAVGDSKSEVVEAALSDWLQEGAELAQTSEAELWWAILDGRDVAVAVPELEGDGGWVVHDVRTCGDPSVGSASIDGVLDCANDYRWFVQASLDPAFHGAATAEEAITALLEQFKEHHGGEVVLVEEQTGSLVVDDREQVVARAGEAPAGGWAVSVTEGCEGYEL